jgi:hypothetical protein
VFSEPTVAVADFDDFFRVLPLDLPASGTCTFLSRHIAQGGTAMERPLTVGQLARATGVPAKTIRYYEQVGVLPVPRRSDAPSSSRLLTSKCLSGNWHRCSNGSNQQRPHRTRTGVNVSAARPRRHRSHTAYPYHGKEKPCLLPHWNP